MKIILIVVTVFIVLVSVYSAGQYWYVNYKLEKPEYTIIADNDGYEIREYSSYITASVVVLNDGNALNNGFRQVAGYIFGDNTMQGGSNSKSVAMTAPVISNTSQAVAMTSPVVSGDNSDGTKTVSFIMPSQYTLESLPTPNNDNVILTKIPAQQWAVLRFTNWYDEEKQRRLVTKLRNMLDRDSIEYNDEWQFAGYDPPSTLPFLRTNEIWVKLK